MSEALNFEQSDGIALLTLNRPEALNALSRDLRTALVQAFRDMQEERGIRVAVLTGAGTAFCAGLDLKELASGDGESIADDADNSVVQAMADFDRPIIAAVNGHAVTGGFELALACDIIIASSHACFIDTHSRVGILPGWGLGQRLPRLIGLSRAKQLSFTATPLSAQRAYEWGLVNEVLAPELLIPQALAMAAEIAQASPPLITQYKALIDQGYTLPLDEALAWEEQKAIASAKAVTAEAIASRRDRVMSDNRRHQAKD